MSRLAGPDAPVDRYYDDIALVDLLDQLLSTGVVLSGDVLLSVAGVDLVWVGLQAILSSVETARPRGSGRVSPDDRPRPLGRDTQRGTPLEPGPATSSGAQAHPASTLPTSWTQSKGARVTDRLEPARDRNRLEVSPEKVEQGLVRLVLTIVELLRQLLERQAIDRMDGGSLTDHEIERLGQAFAALDERMQDLKEFFGIDEDDLQLTLGPLADADHTTRTKGEKG